MVAPWRIVVDRLFDDSAHDHLASTGGNYVSCLLDSLRIGEFNCERAGVWWTVKDEICLSGFTLVSAGGNRCEYDGQNKD